MREPAKSPNIMVNPSPAQNSSWSASGSTPNTVVSVVTMIGCKRDFPAPIIEWRSSIPFSKFLLILSIRIIASLTTTQVRAINQIINGIE